MLKQKVTFFFNGEKVGNSMSVICSKNIKYIGNDKGSN
jgi:hypothetical protein